MSDIPKSLSQIDTYSEAETIARREAALKRVFAMSHKPNGSIGKLKRVESDKKG